MRNWLHTNLPGKPSHTPARWKKLNDAFGEGWEARRLTCLPCYRLVVTLGLISVDE